MTDDVIFVSIIFGGMLLFGAIVVGYDLLAERQHRRERERGRRRSA